MKLSTLKTAERAAYHLMTAFEKDRKTDPKAQRLYDEASKLWRERHEAWNTANVAQAKRRDHGRVLFTIFVPNRNGMREVVRTPHRLITTNRWKNCSGDGYHDSEPYTQVCGKHDSPEWHFGYYMHSAQS